MRDNYPEPPARASGANLAGARSLTSCISNGHRVQPGARLRTAPKGGYPAPLCAGYEPAVQRDLSTRDAKQPLGRFSFLRPAVCCRAKLDLKMDAFHGVLTNSGRNTNGIRKSGCWMRFRRPRRGRPTFHAKWHPSMGRGIHGRGSARVPRALSGVPPEGRATVSGGDRIGLAGLSRPDR